MTYESIAFFELILDVLGLVICLSVLVYVARRGKGWLRPRSGRRSLAEAGVFSAEMRLRTVQQQAEAALAALNNAVAGLEPGETSSFPDEVSPAKAPPPAAAPPASVGTPYQRVRELAGQGMDVDEIYRKLHISKGEIRLALQMEKGERGKMRISA